MGTQGGKKTDEPMGYNGAKINMVIPKQQDLQKLRGSIPENPIAQRTCQNTCLGNCNIVRLSNNCRDSLVKINNPNRLT